MDWKNRLLLLVWDFFLQVTGIKSYSCHQRVLHHSQYPYFPQTCTSPCLISTYGFGNSLANSPLNFTLTFPLLEDYILSNVNMRFFGCINCFPHHFLLLFFFSLKIGKALQGLPASRQQHLSIHFHRGFPPKLSAGQVRVVWWADEVMS